jgi:hypothetical protein
VSCPYLNKEFCTDEIRRDNHESCKRYRAGLKRTQALLTWARLSWMARMTQWVRGDERRGFSPWTYSRIGGCKYQLSNGYVVLAETMSQWGKS